MAELKLVYSQLRNASKEANRVADNCESYYNELKTKFLDKACGQDFPASPISNDGVSIAIDYVVEKRKILEAKKKKYSNFANKIDTLISNAETADTNVAKSVNNSRDTFLSQHSNLKGDGWSAFFATLVVDVPFFGWIAEKASSFIEGVKSLSVNLRYWYEVCGGKKIVDTALTIAGTVLAVVGLVVAVVGMFSISGIWGAIVAVATLFSAIIAFANSCVKLYHTIKGNGEEDPAWAQYYGSIDKASTAFRKTTFVNKFAFLNKWSGGIAQALDVTELVCSVISIADGIKNMYSRSGLNALFGNKKDVCKPGKHEYTFDVTKFKQAITSREGWGKIGETLRKNLKFMVFGNPSQDGLWKAQMKRYTRAMKKTDSLKKATALCKLIKGDLGKINNLGNTIKVAGEFVMYGFSGKAAYKITKNMYGDLGKGGLVKSGFSIYDAVNSAKINQKNKESYTRVLKYMSSIETAGGT